ncbi:RNA recognition motif domain-containing protein [Cyclospora cayetanensis]|uniref:RNA recognition motif domain-containing protein n=1 Tax=Cyclospora cayetanensis TaxID=88456 RepID=A0A1D3CZG1_9EIME|nr:RNA recognition motif domain-containing protein [Cyclospora cayetanensis]
MQEYGQVASLFYMADQLQQQTGWAFVTFCSPSEAQKAVEAIDGQLTFENVLRLLPLVLMLAPTPLTVTVKPHTPPFNGCMRAWGTDLSPTLPLLQIVRKLLFLWLLLPQHQDQTPRGNSISPTMAMHIITTLRQTLSRLAVPTHGDEEACMTEWGEGMRERVMTTEERHKTDSPNPERDRTKHIREWAAEQGQGCPEREIWRLQFCRVYLFYRYLVLMIERPAVHAIRGMHGFLVGGKHLKVQMKKGEDIRLTPALKALLPVTHQPGGSFYGGGPSVGGSMGGGGMGGSPARYSPY